MHVEKYTGASKIKHSFDSIFHLRAVCGRMSAWYFWENDKEGLASRRMCQLCEKRRRLDSEAPTSAF